MNTTAGGTSAGSLLSVLSSREAWVRTQLHRQGCDGRSTHRTSPDLIRGPWPPSTRVEQSVGPGSAAGEVQWLWRGRRTALPLSDGEISALGAPGLIEYGPQPRRQVIPLPAAQNKLPEPCSPPSARMAPPRSKKRISSKPLKSSQNPRNIRKDCPKLSQNLTIWGAPEPIRSLQINILSRIRPAEKVQKSTSFSRHIFKQHSSEEERDLKPRRPTRSKT
ncbi:hypothetical protein [Devosia sp. DBB001]|nr:hypothetical protein [Devosia sp. DBB001]